MCMNQMEYLGTLKKREISQRKEKGGKSKNVLVHNGGTPRNINCLRTT